MNRGAQRLDPGADHEAGNHEVDVPAFAAELVAFLDQFVAAARDLSLADGGFKSTVGLVQVEPGSTNVIPHEVSFNLDLRAGGDADLDRVVDSVRQEFEAIAAQEQVVLAFEEFWRLSASTFDENWRHVLCDSARQRGFEWIDVRGGIGHDSLHLAGFTRAAMVFAQTRNGLSHREEEFAPWDSVCESAQTLIDAAIRTANE